MKRLLVVEDNRITGNLIRNRIAAALPEVQVDWAQSLAETLRFLDRPQPEAVYFAALLDYVLPDAPGGEVIDAVTAAGVPSVVFTANMFSPAERERLWRKAIVDYVIKDEQSLNYVVGLLARLEKNPATKVLVVDDSRFFRVVLTRLLRVHRYQVFEAADGEAGLAVLARHPDVRLVITDCMMPKMDGFTFIRRLRRDHPRDRLAVLGLASEREPDTGARLLKTGADDFISKKHFLTEEFYCRVHQALENLERIETIRRLATTDPLTGLYNRRHFYDSAAHLVAAARRNRTPVACAMIDIDHFKRINDHWGHQVGDAALKHVAGVLAGHFRRGADLLARTGGEEFSVLICGLAPEAAAEQCERLRRRLADTPFPLPDGTKLQITASIGLCTRNVGDLDSLLRHADGLLYEAKRAGRNRLCSDLPVA
ncbi:MAG: diguanylate cyclase [Gammaproteobacteria bacterium]|nr:MAG: diguanylate cyclase [Gammaproteobacteria bacterium]